MPSCENLLRCVAPGGCRQAPPSTGGALSQVSDMIMKISDLRVKTLLVRLGQILNLVSHTLRPSVESTSYLLLGTPSQH